MHCDANILKTHNVKVHRVHAAPESSRTHSPGLQELANNARPAPVAEIGHFATFRALILAKTTDLWSSVEGLVFPSPKVLVSLIKVFLFKI